MAAVTTDLVADAVTADVITIVDVTTDAVFPLETAPADATFSGSSFFFAPAAVTVWAAITAAATETVTAAGSSSFFCSFAMDAETTADADLKALHKSRGLPYQSFYNKSGQWETPPVPY